MRASRVHRGRAPWLALTLASLISACASTPEPTPVAEERVATVAIKVDETAMLPLLGYFQLLQHMTPQELMRERSMLSAIPQTPPTQVRMAMVLGQGRGPMDLVKALGLLDGLLKSTNPEAASLFPLVRMLSSQYQERLRLDQERVRTEQERTRLEKKIEALAQQLKDSQRKSDELQEKLDAMANIEHSIPVLPTVNKKPPGSPR